MVDGEGTDIIYSYDDAGRLTEGEEGANTRGTYILDAAGKLTRLTGDRCETCFLSVLCPCPYYAGP